MAFPNVKKTTGQLHVVIVFVELTFDFSHVNIILNLKKQKKEEPPNWLLV